MPWPPPLLRSTQWPLEFNSHDTPPGQCLRCRGHSSRPPRPGPPWTVPVRAFPGAESPAEGAVVLLLRAGLPSAHSRLSSALLLADPDFLPGKFPSAGECVCEEQVPLGFSETPRRFSIRPAIRDGRALTARGLRPPAHCPLLGTTLPEALCLLLSFLFQYIY